MLTATTMKVQIFGTRKLKYFEQKSNNLVGRIQIAINFKLPGMRRMEHVFQVIYSEKRREGEQYCIAPGTSYQTKESLLRYYRPVKIFPCVWMA